MRCFSDKVYEAQQWPAVSRLESSIFSILSVYLEELRFLAKDDLLDQIQSKVAETGFPQDEVASILSESFIGDFLREHIGSIANFLSGLPPGDCIPVEICVACQRGDVLMRCLEESPEFARSIQDPGYGAWLEEKEREIEACLERYERGASAEEI